MTDLLFLLIYFGGFAHYIQSGQGFWSALGWPYDFGVEIAKATLTLEEDEDD